MSTSESLAHVLADFSGQVNRNDNLRATLATWRPDFFIQARDTGDTFRIHFADSKVERIEPVSTEPSDDALLLRAAHEDLYKIFKGQLSPLAAYTDGLLEVYGNQKDQIKLDVIALVLWGA